MFNYRQVTKFKIFPFPTLTADIHKYLMFPGDSWFEKFTAEFVPSLPNVRKTSLTRDSINMERAGSALQNVLIGNNISKNTTVGPPTAVENLRGLLSKKDNIVVCPGVYDGLTARIALHAGFDCLYMVSLLITIPYL